MHYLANPRTEAHAGTGRDAAIGNELLGTAANAFIPPVSTPIYRDTFRYYLYAGPYLWRIISTECISTTLRFRAWITRYARSDR